MICDKHTKGCLQLFIPDRHFARERRVQFVRHAVAGTARTIPANFDVDPLCAPRHLDTQSARDENASCRRSDCFQNPNRRPARAVQ